MPRPHKKTAGLAGSRVIPDVEIQRNLPLSASRKPERLLLQVRLYNLKPLLYAKELHTREAASDFLQKITRLLIHLSAMRQPARRFAPMAEDISINLMNLALNIFNREAHGDAHRT